MTLDWRALGYAVLIEVALLILAAFGGPHGELVAAMLQVGLWYLGLRLVRRRKVRKAESAA